MSWIDQIWPHLIKQESGGNPNAVSPVGAFGTAQLMPDTAKDPGLGVRPFNASIPGDNERMGKDYLTALYKRYNGDPVKTLAAYNWGMGNVDKWDGDPNKLPAETRGYIANITGAQPQQGIQVTGSMGGGTGHTNSATTSAPGPVQVTGEFGSKAGVGPSATGSTMVAQGRDWKGMAKAILGGMTKAPTRADWRGQQGQQQPQQVEFQPYTATPRQRTPDQITRPVDPLMMAQKLFT